MEEWLKSFANQPSWRKYGIYILMLLIAIGISFDAQTGVLKLAKLARNLMTCTLMIWGLGYLSNKYKKS